jgi:large subunit ribosomal protein L29
MMKAEELKGKSADELKKMLLEKRKEQFNLRFQLSGGQLENTSQMRKLRRDIARVKTMMNQQAVSSAA